MMGIPLLSLLFWICAFEAATSHSNLIKSSISLESKEATGLCEAFLIKDKYNCEPMKCYWSDWKNRNITSNKIVLGYLHNGLGNQLYQSSFTFGVAGALGAKVYFAKIDPSLHLPPGDANIPPNTESAFELIQEIIPKVFSYDLLPEDSFVKRLCKAEPYYLSDRPYEVKRGSLSDGSRKKLEAILSDPEPRCIRLCGYWQGPKVCWADAKEIWSLDKAVDNIGNVSLASIKSGKYDDEKAVKALEASRRKDTLTRTVVNITEIKMISNEKEDRMIVHENVTKEEYRTKYPDFSKFPVKLIKNDVLANMLGNITLHKDFKSIMKNQTLPSSSDICVYLRCLPSHYYFNHELFYDMIFNNTNYDDIWVFENPYCRQKAYKHRVNLILKYMYTTRQAKRFQMNFPYVDVNLNARDALLGSFGMSKEFLSGHFAADEELKVHVQADLKEAHHMFVDLYALTTCKKLVLPHSSWAIWAGTLSNAVEIHVNVPPYFALMNDPAFIYHDEGTGNYWGSYSNKLNRFQYRYTGLPPIEPERRLSTWAMIDMDYEDAYT